MNPQPRLWSTFAITSLALFAFTLDRLVVAIALPAIRTDLGARAADLEWTVNAYTLSFAVLLLTGGALGELAAVVGVAVLGLVFAGHGGYASRADFVGGFVPAMWVGAVLAAVGVLAATALPAHRGGTAARGLTDRPGRCENDARDAAPAGAAGRAADARYGRRTRRHGAGVGRPAARRGRDRQDQPRARFPGRDGWPSQGSRRRV